MGVLCGHTSGVLCLVAVDQLVWSGSDDTTIKVGLGWPGPIACAERLCAAQRATMLYVARPIHPLQVWNVATRTALSTLTAHTGRISALVLVGDKVLS